MFVFAHTGIVLGAATAIAAAVNRRQEKVSWFASLSKYADIRFLVIGSMLPDIIDKPVGEYLFSATFDNGRIFSHTLIFLAMVTIIGIVAYKTSRCVWGFSLAAGTLAHLILDEMWAIPKTLLWPFMGFGFEKLEITDYAQSMFKLLIANPGIYISETIGLIILIWFGLAVVKKKQIGVLIRTGRVS
jgi:inner membrane protein